MAKVQVYLGSRGRRRRHETRLETHVRHEEY